MSAPGYPPPPQAQYQSGAPGGHPQMQYQAGPPQAQYQAGAPPPGQYPPAGQYPPGQYQAAAPPGQYPPGAPAGQYPPPGMPPGQYTPGVPPGAPPPGVTEASAPPVQLADDDLPMEPDDGQDAAPPAFVPTDTAGLKEYEGYHGVNFQPGQYLPPPPPPSYSEAVSGGAGDLMEFSRTANISEAESREALLEFVNTKTCWGKGAAEKMDMTNIAPCNALHYILETFCEGRTTARTEVPYYGGTIDGPEFGAPPMPWDIPCEPSSGHFCDQLYNIPVPHTAEIRTCSMCMGMRMIFCPTCRGSAWVRCRSCFGRGHRGTGDNRRTCTWCHGRGRRRCSKCHMGRITCPHCAGNGQVVNYIQLTVAYMNYKKDYIFEQTDMPDELVRTVEGEQIFQQTQFMVTPVTAFPVKEINENSQRMIEAEKTMHPVERQLNQRQTLRAVPVTQVDYKFKDTESKFFVYGNERKIYAPDYPQQCCWGCNIL